MYRTAALLFAVVFAAGCASTTKPVDMNEPRRVLGMEGDVRLDAEVYQDHLAESIAIPISYDVTNHRANTILIADLLPVTSYDPETQTVTITLGSEVPGEQFLPRLIPIKPEERRSFSSVAHVTIMPRAGTPWQPQARLVVLKLHFLTDAKPFAQLVDIKEKAVYDPKLAADLFPKWVDGNDTVVTNTLPMRWAGTRGTGMDATPAALPRTRRSDRP